MSEKFFLFISFAILIITLASCSQMTVKEHELHAKEIFVEETSCTENVSMKLVKLYEGSIGTEVYKKSYIFNCGRVSYSCITEFFGPTFSWRANCFLRNS